MYLIWQSTFSLQHMQEFLSLKMTDSIYTQTHRLCGFGKISGIRQDFFGMNWTFDVRVFNKIRLLLSEPCQWHVCMQKRLFLSFLRKRKLCIVCKFFFFLCFASLPFSLPLTIKLKSKNVSQGEVKLWRTKMVVSYTRVWPLVMSCLGAKILLVPTINS